MNSKMNEAETNPSIKLFFESFSKHLCRIRDDGKDPGQAYRAQILLGQLHQFEKAIEELQTNTSPASLGQTPPDWLQITDFEALIHWLTSKQEAVTIGALFYLDQRSVWQRLFGEMPFPGRLKVADWLERGTLALLEEGQNHYIIYVHGQPRLLIVAQDALEEQAQTLIRFVSRLLPLFISAEVIQTTTIQVNDPEMIAVDAHFLEILALIKRVATKDVNILLEGESGTGKEVVAGFIHKHSTRAGKPFVAVNCAAIPAGLIESELFGHEKGAFTGAHQHKIGRLEEAQGGTLFLDEIGEVELAMQAKLLRFIQLREFHRVGGRQKMRVNIRLVAATNRELKTRVAEGHFREDLFYRLSVSPFRVPPLRERVDDIFALTQYFMKKYASEFKMELPEVDGSVYQLMARYAFPGNVRELENLIQNILVLSQGERIMPSHLPAGLRALEPVGEEVRGEQGRVRSWRPTSVIDKRIRLSRLRGSQHANPLPNGLVWRESSPQNNDELKQSKQDIQDYAKQETLQLERRFLNDLLLRAEGSMPIASKLSGINRTLLYKMLDRNKIQVASYKTPDTD